MSGDATRSNATAGDALGGSATPGGTTAVGALPTAVFVRRLQLGGDGPRVAIKDSIDIAGHPTQCGSAVLADAPPATRHAVVVQRLLDAGCRIIGKTNLHELAYGVTGINRWTGTPVNPRHPDRVPGGSSSGSAVAVASGEVEFAIGTDTGGSIRIPAACCDVYGLKPTYGRVSRDGVHPPESSLDCVGPFARDLATLERAMALLEPGFLTQPTPVTARVGVLTLDSEPDIAAAVHGALTAAGVTLEAVRLPSFDAAFTAGLTLIAFENWAAYGHLTESPLMGADVRARLLAARDVSREDYAAAERCRATFRAEIDAALERVDVLALPTLPGYPLTLAEAADAKASLRTTAYVRPFNVSGHPALSVPLAPAATRHSAATSAPPAGPLAASLAASLPASLQLVGRQGADAALCAVARLIEAVRESA